MRLPWFESAKKQALDRLSPVARRILADAVEGVIPHRTPNAFEQSVVAALVRTFQDEVCASMEKLRAMTGMKLVAGEFRQSGTGPNVRFILAGKGMIFRIEPPEMPADERKEP